jgi:hypothetical protein
MPSPKIKVAGLKLPNATNYVSAISLFAYQLFLESYINQMTTEKG